MHVCTCSVCLREKFNESWMRIGIVSQPDLIVTEMVHWLQKIQLPINKYPLIAQHFISDSSSHTLS